MAERTYRIGEAARLLELEGYVLRFWETEFAELRPRRTPKGQRLYTDADLALLRRIRQLLHEQGMTIEGARRVLAGKAASPLDAAAGGEERPDRVSPPAAAAGPAQGCLPAFAPSSPFPAPASSPSEEACRRLLIEVERELALVQQWLRSR